MSVIRLFSTPSVEEQWNALAGPWLRQQAGVAWKSTRPTVILTPSRAEGFYLRSRLVDQNIPFLGLRFWTPSDARKFLQGELSSKIQPATQAELRLVARICAEKLVRQNGSEENASLTSVVREPGAFLRAYDLLLGAGWNPAVEGSAYGQKLAEAMQRELKTLHIATQASMHRHLLQAASISKQKGIANLLVIGFNATHWPIWDLLKAIILVAEESTIAFSEPRVFAEEVDQLWISSWEEVTGVESISPSDAEDLFATKAASSISFSALAAAYEKGEPGDSAKTDLTLLVTPGLTSQVQAIALQVVEYLKRKECTRLGIVFPEANALALGVADELRRLGIPLDDGTGAWMPGLFERRCWLTWVALQEEPSVGRLMAWLRACEAQGVSWGEISGLSAREIVDILEGALGESLVDDLSFLSRQLEEGGRGRRDGEVADFLRNRISLPDSATFAEFLELTREALSMPGWAAYSLRLQLDPPAWLLKSDWTISRRIFLEWLKETTESRIRTRGPDGNHFYGKVHLLIYAQMTGQMWSHLILTGLNEGLWPRVFETGAFGSRYELALLNRQARALNRRTVTQGGQGIGHEIVRSDRGHCLLPLEQQDLALRDLCAALEGTSHAVCLTAMTTENGRSLLPSDFFSHAYQAKTETILNEELFRNLAYATDKWCRKHAQLLRAEDGVVENSQAIAATRIAYEARRDIARPFGPYEFSFKQSPVQPIQLSCKDWQEAWNHPASAWITEVVGASPWPEGILSWPRAVGTWVHRWLATALVEGHKRNSTAEFPVLLWAAADREAMTVRKRAQEMGLELYSWWDQVWGQARTIALGLAETLAPFLPERQFLSEFRLPQEVKVALPGATSTDFLLKGRIDLLLIEPGTVPYDSSAGDFSGCVCWVIDFKTGAAQALSVKKIEEGAGLQPVLYALAVRALGAKATAISLHTADVSLKLQVQLEDVLKATSLFRSLNKFHREGIFGMRADAANAYGYSASYPMATRFIPTPILEAKWTLTHGAGPLLVEESE
jgi:hypothetical protein